MNPIFQTIIIAYLFLMVPFHFGILETVVFRKKQKCLSAVLAEGYLVMMATFCVVSVIAIKMQWTLSDLTKIWVFFVAAVSVLASLLGFKKIKKLALEMHLFWNAKAKEESTVVRRRYRLLAVLIVMLIVSVFFTRPSYEDATLEIVTTTVATNAMYQHNPYNGLLSGSAMEGHAYSPIEMLYGAGVALTGIEVPYMLYYLIPVCILIYFYMGIWNLGKLLLFDEEKVTWFVLLVTGIYWMTTYLERQSLVTGIFLNSWNGLTLLSCFVMPVVFGNCVEWMKQEDWKMSGLLEILFKAVVFGLAGQLTNAKGGFYIGLMLLATLAVIIVRKGYDYVITSGRFKKRV